MNFGWNLVNNQSIDIKRKFSQFREDAYFLQHRRCDEVLSDVDAGKSLHFMQTLGEMGDDIVFHIGIFAPKFKIADRWA